MTGTQSDALAEGNIDVSWTPWSKTTCDIDGVCSSSSAGLTYKLYRFLDPNFYGAKPSVMRWSVNLTGGAYPTDQLLDPLLIDANWGAVYTAASATGKLIATITNCEPTNLGNCHFNDNGSAGTDFSAGKMYEYVLVVGDGSQNFRYAEVQRHRSVLINGNASAYSTGKSPPMRLEPRFRKAGVFPIDPGYQSFQTNPQYMVHVPMDISGLDRDFFIHKYEAAFVSGTLDGAFGNLPRTPSNPGSCFESVSATNTITRSQKPMQNYASGFHVIRSPLMSVSGV
ncbi:MAG: hypothetical protein EOP04_10865 [Proteobacteria bacterium]|nr:MAG: hypothetical protein EOP04_10865 [Pseudomonadota bacterium]